MSQHPQILERLVQSAGLIVLVAACVANVLGGGSANLPGNSDSEWVIQTTQPAKAQGEITELVRGQVVENRMSTGDNHTLRVRLSVGQYLRIVIEQVGINIIVTALDPNGQKIVEVDNPSGAYGPEYVSLVAEKQGDYLLQLRTSIVRTNKGRYSASIDALHPATTEDRKSAAIEKTFAEGRQLLEQSSSRTEPDPNKRWEEARQKFEETLLYWSGRKLARWEALALYSLGTTHRRLSHLKTASEYFRKALDLREQLEPHDWRLIASLWNDNGLNYSELAEYSLAVESLKRAHDLFKEKQDQRGEGTALINIGLNLYRVNRVREGLDSLEKALPLRIEEKDLVSQANILNIMGNGYESLGEPHRALKFFDESLEIFGSLRESDRERNGRQMAALFNSRALVYHTFGEWELAIDNYKRAFNIFQRLDARSTARTQNNLGKLYYDLGNSERALKELELAAKLSEKIDDPITKAEVFINIGEVKAAQGETDEALALFIKARSLEATDGVRAAVLTNIGSMKILKGEPLVALDSFTEALKLYRKIESIEKEAGTLQRRAEAYLKLGDKTAALEDFRQALEYSNAIAAPQGKIDALCGLARVERELNNLSAALVHSQEALALIESQRIKVPSQQLRASYFATQIDQYELYIDLMMGQYRATQSQTYLTNALLASERSRTRNLIELLTEADVDLRTGVDLALLEQERKVQQELNAKAQVQRELLSRKHSKEEAANINREVDQAIAEYDAVKETIRRNSPAYAQLTQPQSLNLSEIQQLLDDETLLLEYFLGEERSYLWLVSRNSVIGVNSLPKRSEIESRATAFYESLTQRPSSESRTSSRKKPVRNPAPSYRSQAAALSQMLLGPIADRIGNKRLLIVGDGVLQYLPFAALPAPSRTDAAKQKIRESVRSTTPYLLEEHEIIYLPSASTLAVVRNEADRREPGPLSVAVLANPVFSSDDYRLTLDRKRPPASNLTEGEVRRSGLKLVPLPGTKIEAEEIRDAIGRDRTKIAENFEASRATVMGLQATGYRVVHFATHGDLDAEHPELSSIVLSLYDADGRRDEKGFLRLHDIYNLKLPAELIVLSACSTGLGRVIKGEGLVGLTRGFMHAGSPRIVASLWRVEDLGTAELMGRFYEHMAKDGMAPPLALRQAQVKMLQSKRWKSPYYWASFVLQGEWRPIR